MMPLFRSEYNELAPVQKVATGFLGGQGRSLVAKAGALHFTKLAALVRSAAPPAQLRPLPEERIVSQRMHSPKNSSRCKNVNIVLHSSVAATVIKIWDGGMAEEVRSSGL